MQEEWRGEEWRLKTRMKALALVYELFNFIRIWKVKKEGCVVRVKDDQIQYMRMKSKSHFGFFMTSSSLVIPLVISAGWRGTH